MTILLQNRTENCPPTKHPVLDGLEDLRQCCLRANCWKLSRSGRRFPSSLTPGNGEAHPNYNHISHNAPCSAGGNWRWEEIILQLVFSVPLSHRFFAWVLVGLLRELRDGRRSVAWWSWASFGRTVLDCFEEALRLKTGSLAGHSASVDKVMGFSCWEFNHHIFKALPLMWRRNRVKGEL